MFTYKVKVFGWFDEKKLQNLKIKRNIKGKTIEPL